MTADEAGAIVDALDRYLDVRAEEKRIEGLIDIGSDHFRQIEAQKERARETLIDAMVVIVTGFPR